MTISPSDQDWAAARKREGRPLVPSHTQAAVDQRIANYAQLLAARRILDKMTPEFPDESRMKAVLLAILHNLITTAP